MGRDHEQWRECQPGVLSGMVAKLQQKSQRRRAVSRAVLGFGLVAVVGIVGGSMLLVNQSAAGQISCDDAFRMFAAYREGKLSGTTRKNFENHLQRCPHCRDRYERAYQLRQSAVDCNERDVAGKSVCQPCSSS